MDLSPGLRIFRVGGVLEVWWKTRGVCGGVLEVVYLSYLLQRCAGVREVRAR
jgi:hypothetical protein